MTRNSETMAELGTRITALVQAGDNSLVAHYDKTLPINTS